MGLGRGMIRGGCWSIWRWRSPTAPRRSATSRSWPNRCGRDTGLGRLPSRGFGVNAAWLTAAMIAVDLFAYAQTLLLNDTPLARVEPKTLRYRLLHVAGRLTRGGRRLRLRTHLRTAVKDACRGCHAAAGWVGRV